MSEVGLIIMPSLPSLPFCFSLPPSSPSLYFPITLLLTYSHPFPSLSISCFLCSSLFLSSSFLFPLLLPFPYPLLSGFLLFSSLLILYPLLSSLVSSSHPPSPRSLLSNLIRALIGLIFSDCSLLDEASLRTVMYRALRRESCNRGQREIERLQK